MSSFFTTPASQRKRKRQETSSAPASRKRTTTTGRKPAQSTRARTDSRKPEKDDDESISGSDSGDASAGNDIAASDDEGDENSTDDDAQDTAAERRLKLAERYLDNIRAEVGEEQQVGFDAADVDRELIAARLKEDVAEGKGRVYRFIASSLDFQHASRSFFRIDALSTLAVTISVPFVYTASKDMRLTKWQLVPPRNSPNDKTTTRRLKPKLVRFTRGNKNRAKDLSYQHHTAPILCIAASADGKYLVTGGADRRLIIWDPSSLKPLKVFTHHRDAVTALAFRGKTNQLFSASKDRTVKIWSLDELAYIETLFGHQDEVVDVAALGGSQERCVSVGARDRTARLWKVVEESQLVFRGGGLASSGSSSLVEHESAPNGLPNSDLQSKSLSFAEGSIDRVAQIDSQLFVTGSDSGALSLFSLHKKKPLHTYPLAHGYDPPPSLSRSSAEMDTSGKESGKDVGAQPTPRWITALKAIPFSDLFVSGSWDGVVKIWRVAGKDDDLTDNDADIESRAKNLRRIELMASLDLSAQDASATLVNGFAEGTIARARGIVNDLAIVERGERGKDGVCIVAAIGTELRLGRWMKTKGKNGSVVFEVPRHII